LGVAFKPPAILSPFGESLLAVVAKRRMADVVSKAGCFHDVGVKP
jgi:hypothetical protein